MGPHGVSTPAVASSALIVQLDSQQAREDDHTSLDEPLVHNASPQRSASRSASDDSVDAAVDHVTSSLRQHTVRIRTLKVRAEFEYTLLIVLSIHVIYMYYLDHTLLVFLIRASQLIRLLYFPCENPHSQRGTAFLLLLSNLPVLAIHHSSSSMQMASFVLSDSHSLACTRF
ncbi:unnamed protein product [Agarophyton chilense]